MLLPFPDFLTMRFQKPPEPDLAIPQCSSATFNVTKKEAITQEVDFHLGISCVHMGMKVLLFGIGPRW